MEVRPYDDASRLDFTLAEDPLLAGMRPDVEKSVPDPLLPVVL
jgi:hypothetical protein